MQCSFHSNTFEENPKAFTTSVLAIRLQYNTLENVQNILSRIVGYVESLT